MKTIFTLLTSLILSVAVFAGNHPRTSLVIKSSDQNDIRVVIDGRRFEPNDYHLSISDLQPGYHTVKIYRERNFGIFTIFGQRYDMVFNNIIVMRPFSSQMILIDRFGRSRIIDSHGRGGREYDYQMRDLEHDHDFDYGNGRNFGDYGEHDHNYNDRDSRWGDIDHNSHNGQVDDHSYDGQWDNQGQGNHDGRFDNRDDKGYSDNSYNRAISDLEFNRVLSSMENEWSENNRAKSALQIINTNYFTSVQVKQMLQMFSLESNKLNLAEQAYSKTIDQRNYFTINDVFSLSSSKDELTRFIRSH